MPSPSKFEQLRRGLPHLTLVQGEKLAAPKILNEIHQLSNEALFGGKIENSEMAQAARAGMILAAGGWDAAHRIVQEMDTREAEYWHGIVHRREPDSSNSKYWFRRVRHHVVMDQLLSVATRRSGPEAEVLRQLTKAGRWDPFHFVDMCMACHEGHQRELLPILLDIQQTEITALLDYCIQQARGGRPEAA